MDASAAKSPGIGLLTLAGVRERAASVIPFCAQVTSPEADRVQHARLMQECITDFFIYGALEQLVLRARLFARRSG